MKRLTRIALLACLLAGSSTPVFSQRSSLNERVFDKAWSLVADRYWDRSMAGNDWDAIRDEYYPKAMAARSEEQLYTVVNRMLDQLDDSHVYAISPAKLRREKEPPGQDDEDRPPASAARRLDGGLLLLSFSGFDPGDDRWIRNEIAATPNLRGVILDLRDNLGGRDDVLDKIAGLFTTRKALLIRLLGRSDIEENTRGAGPRSYQGPLALIVGPDTASAAEILAFFLGESGRAITVGERTAGAVTGGVEHDLPGGGRMTLAEYDIRTANGTRLEGRGFTPRNRISSSRKPSDAALAKAVELLKAERR